MQWRRLEAILEVSKGGEVNSTNCVIWLLATVSALVLGCQGSQTDHVSRVTPSDGSMFGYETIRLDLSGLSVNAQSVSELYLGTSKGISLTVVDADTLTFQTHGSSEPGVVSMRILDHDGGEILIDDAFRFRPQSARANLSIGALGASLTQGVQRGVPSTHSITSGPAALVARQMGVYFPLPLLIPDAFREMEASDLGPAPYCNPPALDTFQQDQAIGLIDAMTTAEGRFDFALGRLSPDIQTRNFAVGGMRVGELLDGAPNNDIAINFLSHLVYEPIGTLGTPISKSAVEMLEALSPDLVVCFDCLGNDLIEGMINDAPFDLSEQTPMDLLLSDVERLVTRLSSLSAEVFLATLPKPNVLPFFQLKRTRLIADGTQPDADVLLSSLGESAERVNEHLLIEAAKHQNVHVVDLASLADQWVSRGVIVGDETLQVAPFGGLVGLDGLHFTDVGYALLANTFIEKMNDVLGDEIPIVDVVTVRERDREHPDILQSAERNLSECQQSL